MLVWCWSKFPLLMKFVLLRRTWIFVEVEHNSNNDYSTSSYSSTEPSTPYQAPPPLPHQAGHCIVSSNRTCPAQRADTHPEDSQTLHATILHPWKDIWNIVCMDIYKWSFLLLPSLFRYRYICVVFFNQKQGQNGLERSARWTGQPEMLLNLTKCKLNKV